MSSLFEVKISNMSACSTPISNCDCTCDAPSQFWHFLIMYFSGWYNGKITAFKDGWYVVDWEDDTTNQYDDLAQMKQMVAAAQEHSGSAAVKNAKQRYPLGTPVY